MSARREIEQCHVTETEGEGTLARKVKATSELRPECENGARQEEIWGKGLPTRRNGKCTDVEAVPRWPVRGTTGVRVAGIKEGRGVIGNTAREVGRGQIM